MKNASIAVGITTVALFAPLSLAQPQDFTDVGTFAAPLTPAGQITGTGLVVGGVNAAETPTVKWYRFNVSETVTTPGFVQLSTTASTAFAPPASLSVALYSASGELLATEFGGESAALSFGSAIAGPRQGAEQFGRDGGIVEAGEYYLAVIAGGVSEVSAGATNWNVTTTASLPLDLNNLLSSYAVSLSLSFGNTNPRETSAPANDNCADATNVQAGQLWSGSNELGTPDGDVTCFASTTDVSTVWLRFTAPANGVAEAVSIVQDGSQAVLPLLARFDTCGTASVQCGQLVLFPTTVGSRLTFDAVAGQEYLFSLGGAQGSTGPVNFQVNFAPAAECDSIDFNNNEVFPEDQDVIDFFNVLAGAPCSDGNTCNDIDFNNNEVFPEDQDVIDFFTVLAGGSCGS